MSKKTAVTSFLMICAVAIAATPAFAGGVALQASSLPVQVRGEGLTETVGAVVLQATGPGSITAGSSVTIVYSGSISNSSSFTGVNGINCSGTSVTCTGANMSVAASGTQLTVSFTATTTFAQGDYFEVSQVRMNVNGLGSATTSVTATLSGTSSAPTTNPITFTQSQVVVASVVNPSVAGAVATTAAAIQTCSVGTGNTFSVSATEKYPAAVTSTVDENGFTPITTAANGSQVSIALAGIPAGMAVAPLSYTAKINGSSLVTTSGGSTAIGPSAFGTPLYSGTTIYQGTTAVTTAASFPGSYQVNLVSPTTNGGFVSSTGATITYVFSVSGDSTSAIEGFTVLFGIGLPNSTSTALSGSAAPLPSIGTIATATATVSLSPSSGIVSFATNNEGGGTVATISDCVTNMLFPYVANQNGYDTSFSIANTTSDDLAFGAGAGATAQNGSCTLTLWPTTDTTLAASSPLGSTVQYTTPTINAGQLYAFSMGGNSTPFAGQTGYIIAVCRFLNAHGFAFLTNGFAQAAGPQLSHGYLGLVLPNPIAGRAASNGETLVQ